MAPTSRTTLAALAAALGALGLLVGAGGAGAGDAAAIGSDMPSWSPDGRTIAFVGFRKGRAGDIYTVDAYLGRERRLTATRSHEDTPRWSPEGRRIAFVRAVRFVPQLFVMNADGTGQVQLTAGEEPSFAPSWSPDGRRIAFARGRDHEDSSGVLRADGGLGAHEPGPRTAPAKIYVLELESGRETRLTDGPAIDTTPAWSPDGDRIAFTSNRGEAGAHQLYVMNADGTGVRKLTDHPVSYHTEKRPAWSPDGSTLAFVADNRHTPVGNAEVYLVDADGRNVRRLTHYFGHDDWPTWSPEGQLALARGRTPFRPELFVVGREGGLGARKLTGTYLTFAGLAMVPAAPQAGRPFAVELAVRPGIDGFTDVECRATLGDQLLTDFLLTRAGGRLRCTWELPRHAKGKWIRGLLLASSGGSEVTRSFALRVR